MRLSIINFAFYDEKQEQEGGDYWNFANAGLSEIDNLDEMLLEDLINIIDNLKDENLKLKAKERLIEILKQMKIHVLTEYGEHSRKQLKRNLFFNDTLSEKVKKVLQEDNIIDIEESRLYSFWKEYEDSPEKLNVELSVVINRILNAAIPLEAKNKLIQEMFSNLIKCIRDNGIKNPKDFKTYFSYLQEDLILMLEGISSEHSKSEFYELKKELIEFYQNLLPEQYLNYIKIANDELYIKRYASSLLENGTELSIGIDPRISIGPEIEVNNEYSFTFNPINQKEIGQYIRPTEATVPNGEEISGPPFHDTKEELAIFKSMCDALKKMGFYYDKKSHNCAGQINIGLDYLDTKESILYFFKIFGNCEELLYHICNPEGEIMRQTMVNNSRFKPVSYILSKIKITKDISRNQLIDLLSYEGPYIREMKKDSVCIRDGHDKRRARLEVRIPNGTADYDDWINNIRLFGKIVEISKKMADISLIEESELTEEEKSFFISANNLYSQIRNSKTLEEKLMLLMDLLFDDNNIKQIYINRYNRIAQMKKEAPEVARIYRNYSPYGPHFAPVDFPAVDRESDEWGIPI